MSNQAVETFGATADLSPVSVEDRRPRFDEHLPDKHPIWVTEVEGSVAGWCCLSAYRKGRMALRYTAEISYYIHNDHHRKGLASGLVQHAIEQCPKLQIKTLFAVLLDLNIGSVKLLERFGFTEWGHMPNIADFHGKECGHLIFGKRVPT